MCLFLVGRFESFYFIDIVLELILSSNFIPLWGQVGEDPANEITSVPQEIKGLFNFSFGHDGLVLASFGPYLAHSGSQSEHTFIVLHFIQSLIQPSNKATRAAPICSDLSISILSTKLLI